MRYGRSESDMTKRSSHDTREEQELRRFDQLNHECHGSIKSIEYHEIIQGRWFNYRCSICPIAVRDWEKEWLSKSKNGKNEKKNAQSSSRGQRGYPRIDLGKA